MEASSSLFQCGTLWLVWFIGVVSAEMPCLDQTAVCPNCTLPVQCLADPCNGAICRSSPSATCVVDNCAGCEARFVNSTGHDISSTCNEFLPCSRRSGWDLRVQCSRLQRDSCPESSYCDVDPFGRFATCCCRDALQCSSNLCDRQQCPSYPDAVCQRKCGSCNVMFVTKSGEDVTSKCHVYRPPCSRYGGTLLRISCAGGSQSCPAGAYCDRYSNFTECCCNDTAATCPGCRLPCSNDLCSTTSCPQYHTAVCRVDRCSSSCKARFYHRGHEVTKACCNGPQQVYQNGNCYDSRCLPVNGRRTICRALGGRCHSRYRTRECILS